MPAGSLCKNHTISQLQIFLNHHHHPLRLRIFWSNMFAVFMGFHLKWGTRHLNSSLRCGDPFVLLSVSFSSSYHPQSNGQTERVNRELEAALCCVTTDNPSSFGMNRISAQLSYLLHNWTFPFLGTLLCSQMSLSLFSLLWLPKLTSQHSLWTSRQPTCIIYLPYPPACSPHH